MKELSIEEKAYDSNYKTYTELINRLEGVKDAIKKQNYGIAMDILYKPYPEFQITIYTEHEDGEDDEIRKWVVDELKDSLHNIEALYSGDYDNRDKDDIIRENCLRKALAWLEKQGEPTEINPSEFDLRLNKLLKQFESMPKEELASSLSFYLNVVQNNGTYKEEKQGEQPRKVSIWKHWKDGIAGNGEGKLIYLVKVGNTYRLTSCLGFECDYIELSELDKLMLEKQGETFTKKDVDDAYLKGVCDTKKELEKQGEQKPAEWSEEDVAMLDSAIAFVEHSAFTTIGKGKNNVIAWLKSLKDRYIWKPSKEQMRALTFACVKNVDIDKSSIKALYDLKEQLKQL